MKTKRSTTKERMQEVLSVIGISAAEFERRCGLSHGFVARVTREITKQTRARIKSAFPTLNINYIAFGTGEIFTEEETTGYSSTPPEPKNHGFLISTASSSASGLTP